MARPKKMRAEFIAAAIVIAIIVYAVIAEWWQKNPVIGWIVVIVLLASLGYSLYKFPAFRHVFVGKVKQAGQKAVFEEAASSREPIPPEKRAEILRRANQQCENPACRYKASLHIHHVDMNNSNKNLNNLIALCPNCHQEAHQKKLTFSQLHNWIRADLSRLRSK